MHKGCVLFFCLALLSACGGGGGGGGATTPSTSTPTPQQTPTTPPSTTDASGAVVDDASGNPLSGVRVVLMPWGPCGATPAPASITPENDGCPTPLPSPQATTDASGKFALNGAPNGQYLLVIGSDSTTGTGTVQATVHDNVTLTGGTQTLAAPTMPPVPTITPHAWETNGDYRLATLDATTELPCFQAWQTARANHGLAASAVDEWLLENVRSINTYVSNGGTQPQHSITSGGTFINGGAACADMINTYAFSGSNTYATDARTIWFAAQYVAGTGRGLGEFPIDPRSFADPNSLIWP